jgi:hypothetical protein
MILLETFFCRFRNLLRDLCGGRLGQVHHFRRRIDTKHGPVLHNHFNLLSCAGDIISGPRDPHSLRLILELLPNP